MKGLLPLFLGIFGTFTFSWVGLIFLPNTQIGHLNPQTDEEGNDPYPAPRSGMAERGRQVYVANGCQYCHSQQVRADYAASDIDRKWGERRSAPRDYIFDRPALLGKMRMGPDLANVAKRAPVTDQNAPPPAETSPTTASAPVAAASPATAASPVPTAPPAPAASPTAPASAATAPSPVISPTPNSATISAPPAAGGTPTPSPSPGAAGEATIVVQGEPLPYTASWHHRHLYNPRSIVLDSTMPAYRFLYEKRPIGGQPAADALQFTGSDAPPEGWEIVPSDDAKSLVAYLMSLDQSHPLKEVKSTAPAAPLSSGKQVK